MNLRNPQEVARALRRVEAECIQELRQLESGYVPAEECLRSVTLRLLRGIALVAEALDPEQESVESFAQGDSEPVPMTAAARSAMRELAELAEKRARDVEAAGDASGAAKLWLIAVRAAGAAEAG